MVWGTNFCRHRDCPPCHALATERWFNAQRARLSDCVHRHIVFTLPSALRLLFRLNQRKLTGALFGAVHQSMSTLCKDPRYMGATPGLLLARHT